MPRRHEFKEEFYSVGEVAEMLHVSTKTVRRWIEGRKIMAHQFGRLIRIAHSDLKQFLE
jgi:excisionase family DNA binding protein